MGTSIHIVTEIKQMGRWKSVSEIPESFDKRDYALFHLLSSDLGSYFNQKGFKTKGLPRDISSKKFNFESYMGSIKNTYENGSTKMLVFSDGTFAEINSKNCQKEITEEQYKELERFSEENFEEYRKKYDTLGYSLGDNGKTYFVYSAEVGGGEFKQVPNKVIYPTIEDYIERYYKDDWDEDAQDYGRWDVNFEDEDYHSASYLTLSELLGGKYAEYASNCYKLDKSFYDAFVAAGGTFPETFKVLGATEPSSIVDCMREAFMPTVIVSWPKTAEEKDDLPLYKGINELRNIAEKYDITNYDEIRIIFAFDN